mmetsp:Transcript_8653/g.20254  ORF Transcript_8653/g.20254 Transcript_8653/m.20254 type:complete len:220 (-) Transcript_8653:792-1451(-)
MHVSLALCVGEGVLARKVARVRLCAIGDERHNGVQLAKACGPAQGLGATPERVHRIRRARATTHVGAAWSHPPARQYVHHTIAAPGGEAVQRANGEGHRAAYGDARQDLVGARPAIGMQPVVPQPVAVELVLVGCRRFRVIRAKDGRRPARLGFLEQLDDMMMATASRELKRSTASAAAAWVGVERRVGAQLEQCLGHLVAAVVACLMQWRVAPLCAVG